MKFYSCIFLIFLSYNLFSQKCNLSFNEWELKQIEKVNNLAVSNPEYYIDYGIGANNNKSTAYRAAQIDALRKLPFNINVRIKNCTEITNDEFKIITKAITEMEIINPIYIPLDTINYKNNYYIAVAVKKSRKEYESEFHSAYINKQFDDIIKKTFECK